MKQFVMNFLFLLCINAVWASDVLVLSDKNANGIAVTNNYFEVFEDSTASLSIDSILSIPIQEKFIPVTYNYNIRPKSAYWIKLTVQNKASVFMQYVLENYYLYTKDFSLYFQENGRLYHQTTYEYLTYSNRAYQHKNLVLDFPVPDSSLYRTYYIRVYSELYVSFNFGLKSQHYFTQYSTNEYLLLGVYYGAILLLIFYNFILFITIRSRVYIYYILYLMAGILISLNEDKLGYQYLWPEHPSLNPLLSFHLAPILLVLLFIAYASSFLELYSRARILFYVVWGSFGLYMALFCLNFYFPVFLFMRTATPLPFFMIFVSAILMYLKKFKPARFFILGSGLIVTSIILIQLRALAIIKGSVYTVYFFNYSLIVESIILSFALSDKIKILREEKDSAQKSAIHELKENERLQKLMNQQLYEKQQLQEKINYELEIKVNERTKELSLRSTELEVMNAKLASIIEQTNHMNIQLDLDNWELKKNVRHELVQRITGQEVSFDMFKTVFKDDTTCLRFLEELKWSSGFVCKKCGYTKYKEGDQHFLRKCSRCSHPESVTAGTLLHGIKFSVHHALYLIYLLHARKGELKLEKIAEIAGISVVSASKFRSKTIDKIEQLDKKRKNTTWEEIILN